MYRPPDCQNDEFNEALPELKEKLKKAWKKITQWQWDFNFSQREWIIDINTVFLNLPTLSTQGNDLLQILNDHSIIQYTQELTRGESMLGIIFTNNEHLITPM